MSEKNAQGALRFEVCCMKNNDAGGSSRSMCKESKNMGSRSIVANSRKKFRAPPPSQEN
jgi:hypothetical protein